MLQNRPKYDEMDRTQLTLMPLLILFSLIIRQNISLGVRMKSVSPNSFKQYLLISAFPFMVFSNINVYAQTEPLAINYFEDFEGARADKSWGLRYISGIDSGWQNFAEVYDVTSDGQSIETSPDADGVDQPVLFKQYGPYTINQSSDSAAGDNFSGVACGEAGSENGIQYLNIFSDYQNFEDRGPDNNGNNGRFISTSTFKQQVIDPNAQTGIYTFEFLAKRPIVPVGVPANPCNAEKVPDGVTDRAAGASRSDVDDNGNPVTIDGGTATAFIKVLNPLQNSYTRVDLIQLDMTSTPRDSWDTYSLSIPVTEDHIREGTLADPSYVIQVGFGTLEQLYGNTGVYYDNVRFYRSGDLPEEPIEEEIPIPFFFIALLSFSLIGIRSATQIK